MPIGTRVYDDGLNVLTNDANAVHICSQQPTTFTEATVTYSLGVKASPSIGAPANRSGGGREVTLAAITDGVVTATGTGTHYAVVDTVVQDLLADGEFSAPLPTVADATWTSGAIPIGIPSSCP